MMQPPRGVSSPVASRANVAVILYFAMLNSCAVYAVILWLRPQLMGDDPAIDDANLLGVLKLAFLAMSVPMLVAGNLVANLGIAPKGWERDSAGGWRRAEERLKGMDAADDAESFFNRSLARLIMAMALIEGVAILGLILGLVGAEATRLPGFAIIALGGVSLAALLPRALYVKSAAEGIAAAESAA